MYLYFYESQSLMQINKYNQFYLDIYSFNWNYKICIKITIIDQETQEKEKRLSLSRSCYNTVHSIQ